MGRDVQLRFDADEWKGMTREQRIKRCAVLAEQAQKLANDANAKFKPLYLRLADEWLTLAQEMQREP